MVNKNEFSFCYLLPIKSLSWIHMMLTTNYWDTKEKEWKGEVKRLVTPKFVINLVFFQNVVAEPPTSNKIP